MKRSTPLRSRKPMRKVSDKRKREGKVYRKLRLDFLISHPQCQLPGCLERSTQLHHTHGRYKYFLDESTFLATCEKHHQFIHDNPAWAREHGYLIYGKDGK